MPEARGPEVEPATRKLFPGLLLSVRGSRLIAPI